MSLDGKISTGATDGFDMDLDLPRIPGVREGLHQYYDAEQHTDLWSLNTGRVMAKIGANTSEDSRVVRHPRQQPPHRAWSALALCEGAGARAHHLESAPSGVLCCRGEPPRSLLGRALACRRARMAQDGAWMRAAHHPVWRHAQLGLPARETAGLCGRGHRSHASGWQRHAHANRRQVARRGRRPLRTRCA